ncbi:hypothetical protein [Rhodobacteraceae phage LS06-2018-MD06]|jgi:hypothetical protein|nr:hypothetical protein [Rhodobacteraceae phage LS06-2018-MD06]
MILTHSIDIRQYLDDAQKQNLFDFLQCFLSWHEALTKNERAFFFTVDNYENAAGVNLSDSQYDHIHVEISTRSLTDDQVPHYMVYCVHEVLHVLLANYTTITESLIKSKGAQQLLSYYEDQFVERLSRALCSHAWFSEIDSEAVPKLFCPASKKIVENLKMPVD